MLKSIIIIIIFYNQYVIQQKQSTYKDFNLINIRLFKIIIINKAYKNSLIEKFYNNRLYN